MLDAWRRSEVKVLSRGDQEVTATLVPREVQARRRQNTLLERSPVEGHATVIASCILFSTLPAGIESMEFGKSRTDSLIDSGEE